MEVFYGKNVTDSRRNQEILRNWRYDDQKAYEKGIVWPSHWESPVFLKTFIR